MADLIKNKINEAGLITLDLSDFKIVEKQLGLDLSEWFLDKPVVREKEFREKLSSFPWKNYTNCFVAVFCSKNIIIPHWAYLLVQVNLRKFARQVFFCKPNLMHDLLFQKSLLKLDLKKYENRRVFIKSCSGDVPLSAMSICSHMLSPIVKSLFYGEPCSGVPLLKN